MSEFIKCPVPSIQLKVLGHEKEYTMDTITNKGAINLDNISKISVNEVELEQELSDDLMATFSMFVIVFEEITPTKFENEEPLNWVMHDKESALQFEQALLKGAGHINKLNFKEAIIYGVVNEVDKTTSKKNKTV